MTIDEKFQQNTSKLNPATYTNDDTNTIMKWGLLNCERLNAFPLRWEKKIKDVCSHHFYTTLPRSSSQGNLARKESKSIQIGKEVVKLSLHTDNLIFYIENSKEYTKK